MNVDTRKFLKMGYKRVSLFSVAAGIVVGVGVAIGILFSSWKAEATECRQACCSGPSCGPYPRIDSGSSGERHLTEHSESSNSKVGFGQQHPEKWQNHDHSQHSSESIGYARKNKKHGKKKHPKEKLGLPSFSKFYPSHHKGLQEFRGTLHKEASEGPTCKKKCRGESKHLKPKAKKSKKGKKSKKSHGKKVRLIVDMDSSMFNQSHKDEQRHHAKETETGVSYQRHNPKEKGIDESYHPHHIRGDEKSQRNGKAIYFSPAHEVEAKEYLILHGGEQTPLIYSEVDSDGKPDHKGYKETEVVSNVIPAVIKTGPLFFREKEDQVVVVEHGRAVEGRPTKGIVQQRFKKAKKVPTVTSSALNSIQNMLRIKKDRTEVTRHFAEPTVVLTEWEKGSSKEGEEVYVLEDYAFEKPGVSTVSSGMSSAQSVSYLQARDVRKEQRESAKPFVQGHTGLRNTWISESPVMQRQGPRREVARRAPQFVYSPVMAEQSTYQPGDLSNRYLNEKRKAGRRRLERAEDHRMKPFHHQVHHEEVRSKHSHEKVGETHKHTSSHSKIICIERKAKKGSKKGRKCSIGGKRKSQHSTPVVVSSYKKKGSGMRKHRDDFLPVVSHGHKGSSVNKHKIVPVASGHKRGSSVRSHTSLPIIGSVHSKGSSVKKYSGKGTRKVKTKKSKKRGKKRGGVAAQHEGSSVFGFVGNVGKVEGGTVHGYPVSQLHKEAQSTHRHGSLGRMTSHY